MSSKLTFNDIENQELDPTKLNFTPNSLTNAVSSTSSDPSADAIVGAFAINTASGDIFRKTVAGSGAGNWTKISSITRTVLQNRYRGVSINSAVTSTDGTAPSIGDLVSYCGVGAWAALAGGNISAAKYAAGAAGSQNAGLLAGGINSAATNTADLFNGLSWSAGASLNVARQDFAAFGSQSAGIASGGFVAARLSSTEIFNGTGWAAAVDLSIAKRGLIGAGSQNAGLVAGGTTNPTRTDATELFNGSSWSTSGVLSSAKNNSAGVGSINAALIIGGYGGAALTTSEFFNGSSWSTSGVLSIGKYDSAGGGSQSSAFVTGGVGAAGTNSTTTEVFNGSSWFVGGSLIVGRDFIPGGGSQSAGFIAGGFSGSSNNTTELHSQTIFRKVYAKNLPESNVVGILSSASTVMLQGTNTSVTYPANKYLIANRSQNSALTNYTNLSAITLESILGTAPTMTYSFTTTNLLSVIPGNVVIVSGSVTASNAGAFVISRVISPSSIEIQNANGVIENPATGNLAILNSMLAVDNISPQDIVIGKTDADGLLTVQRPLITGSLLKRLK